MAQPNQPNGMPPQMNVKAQYNGVHSSHSSRDSSPHSLHAKQIPFSQLPPRSAIPSSQLPPSRSPNITQQMSQLNINKINTSTPNQTLQTQSGLVNSAFSPISTTQAPPRISQAPPPSGYNYNQISRPPVNPPNKPTPIVNNQNNAPPPTKNQGQVIPSTQNQGQVIPPTQNQGQNMFSKQNQAQVMPPTQNQGQTMPPLSSSQSHAQPPTQNQGHVTPPTQNQGQAMFPKQSQAQVMPPTQNQGHLPPQIQNQTPPLTSSQGHAPPPTQNQGQTMFPKQNQAQVMPPTQNQGQTMPPTQNQGHLAPQMPPLPSSQGHAPLPMQNQGHMPPQIRNQMPPLINNQGNAPPPTQNQIRPPNINSQGHVPPPMQNQLVNSQATQSKMPTMFNNQGHVPPPTQHQPPVKNQGYVPPPNQVPQYNNFSANQPPPGQPRTNLHSNRYPQAPPSQQPGYPQAPPSQQPGYPQAPPPQQPGYPQGAPNFSQQNFQGQQFYQQNSVTHSGFNKLWGQDHFDLLQNPNVLPREKVAPPKVYLGNELLDSANCSPEVFRCTMTKIPESSSLLQKSRLPLGILIHPFKDLTHLPVIQCNVIVRCRACRTYINPFVFFVDTKRWKCNLCYRVNELPEEFQFDPVSKTYGDPTRRPEIKSSTIEYIAPAEYMLRPPQPAVYLFLFDISRLAIESGYLQSACAVLLEELKNLPGDARTQVGILAYDSALHFFGLGDGLSQPHEMTVLDIDDVFLPCPDNLLVNLKDRIDLLTDLLTQLPTRYNNSYDNSSALGAALQAAHKMMGATGGRVSVFQASLPNIGPGALNPREDPSQRASTEVQHLNPANDFYKRLALECSGQQIAVDLFVLNSQYVDMATISGISRFSGGCIHHFPLFKASRVLQNERFERCFRRYLVRKIGFEAVMRIRCTRGLSIHTFHGNFFVRSTDLLSLPNVSPDAAFGMQVSIDETLSDVQSVCFQAALLYTSSKGERRIRVHTLCLPVCSTLPDVINAADQQCIVGLLAKMAVDRSMQSSLSDAREAFINVAIDILSSYKMSLNMGEGTSGLLAPQCLRLLPLYISALLKSSAFRTGTCTRLDDRVKAMIDMKTKPLSHLIQTIYPDLYPVHNLDEQQIVLNSEEEPIPQPPHLQLTARCLDTKGAFLLDTGEHMILLVCPGVSPVFLNECLGVRDYVSISDEMYELPVLDNLNNQRLHQFINFLNDEKPAVATLHVIRDNSPNRIEFFERLIEDRVENALSYHEFMQHLKTQVK